MLSPQQLGLEAPAESGAIEAVSAPPQDVMEPPAFAYSGDVPPMENPGQGSVSDIAGFLAPTGGAAPAGGGAPQVQAPAGTAPVSQEPGIVPEAIQQQSRAQVQNLRGQLANIERDAEMARLQLIAGGLDEQQATMMTGMAARAAAAEIRGQITEIASTPAVIAHVSADIARRFSLPNSPLTVQDLAGETTVSGMEARARAIQETRRTQSVSQRVERRADVVENAPGASFTSNRGGTGMSPFAMIRSGLSRRTVGR